MDSSKMTIKRTVAFLIDWVIILFVCIFLMFLQFDFGLPFFLKAGTAVFITSYSGIIGLLGFILLPLFRDVMFGNGSIGKKLMGITVVSCDSREKISVGRYILRNLLFYLVIVELAMLLFGNGKTVGDMISKTCTAECKYKESIKTVSEN